MGEISNGAGSSSNMGLGTVRPNELGVQGAKIGKTIKSFDDAYVPGTVSCLYDRHLIAM